MPEKWNKVCIRPVDAKFDFTRMGISGFSVIKNQRVFKQSNMFTFESISSIQKISDEDVKQNSVNVGKLTPIMGMYEGEKSELISYLKQV